VYGDYRDVFPEDFAFFQQGNVDLSDVLAFARDTRCYDKVFIAQSAKQWIDKVILLDDLHKYLTFTFLGEDSKFSR